MIRGFLRPLTLDYRPEPMQFVVYIDKLHKIIIIANMLNRDLEKYLLNISKKFPVISVTGPRQSGKTTLIRKVFSSYDYISLENLDNRNFAKNDPNNFIKQFTEKGIILDEVQRVPEFFSYLQGYIDASQSLGKVVLSGSQNFLLSEHISQSLSGRVKVIKLLPFSYNELRDSLSKDISIEELVFNGMYPVIYDRKLSPWEWYPDYIETYIERDIRSIKNINDLSLFQKFLFLCAGRIGQLLNMNSLANECGISHNTVNSWLSILESSYIIKLVSPYYKNFNKRIIKQKKLYFYDTGLACNLLSINNKEQLSSHYLKGALVENFILIEIIKTFYNRGEKKEIYFFRDSNGNEVDFIYEINGADFKAIEVKSTGTVRDDLFKGLIYWKKLVNSSDKNLSLIFTGDKSFDYKFGSVVSWKDVSSGMDV